MEEKAQQAGERITAHLERGNLASAVILTTFTDVGGFFMFLGLGTIFWTRLL